MHPRRVHLFFYLPKKRERQKDIHSHRPKKRILPNGSNPFRRQTGHMPNGSNDSFHLSSTRKNRRRSSPWFSFAFFSFIKERKEDKGSENKAPINFRRQTRYMPNGSNPFRRHRRHTPIRIHHFKPHKPLLRLCNVLVWAWEGLVRSCRGMAWAENIKWQECYLVALLKQLSRKNVS